MDWGLVLQIFMNGLSLSATYAVIAVGLTLIFGVLLVMNFAHGELLMVGGFVVWLLYAKNNVPFLVAVLASMLFVAAIALAIERGLFKPARGNVFGGLIMAIGLMYVLQVSALLIFGPLDKTVPTALPGAVEMWGASFSMQRLVTIPATIGVVVLVWFMLERTNFGRAVRACTQDSQAALLQGISIDRTSAGVMIVAGALAGLAGALVVQTVPVGPYLGTFVILKAFVIVIVGGMGSVGGTVVAAFMFGFLDSTVSTLLEPRVATLLDVAIMFLILVIRPRGLFGRE